MSKDLPFSVLIAAVLTTALECNPCPESYVCLALDCDLDRWQTVKEFLLLGGLATFPGYSVTLTEKGRALAEKCNALAVR